jgi:transcriptional regulator with XRE-family HTH domain
MEKHDLLRAFGRVVKEERQRQQISQEELGYRCALDRTYISGIERGVRNPTLTVIFAIASGLAVLPSSLLSNIVLEGGKN